MEATRRLLFRAGEKALVTEAPATSAGPKGDAACVVEVLVVSRKDARSRAVKNHDALCKTALASLAKAMPTCAVKLRVFVGKDHSLTSAAAAWRRAHVVIAPHGAALANVLFVRPGTLVVEIGYYAAANAKRPYPSTAYGVGMPWPAPYYWAAAEGAGATLFASMAPGSSSAGADHYFWLERTRRDAAPAAPTERKLGTRAPWWLTSTTSGRSWSTRPRRGSCDDPTSRAGTSGRRRAATTARRRGTG